MQVRSKFINLKLQMCKFFRALGPEMLTKFPLSSEGFLLGLKILLLWILLILLTLHTVSNHNQYLHFTII